MITNILYLLPDRYTRQILLTGEAAQDDRQHRWSMPLVEEMANVIVAVSTSTHRIEIEDRSGGGAVGGGGGDVVPAQKKRNKIYLVALREREERRLGAIISSRSLIHDVPSTQNPTQIKSTLFIK
jgi:hypothetical protein